MSLTQGLPGFITTDGGRKQTRLQGPALSGSIGFDGGVVGPAPVAGGYICVQATASLINQVVSTSSGVLGGHASFVYIPVLAASITGSSNGDQGAAPPYLGCGTPIAWDDTNKWLVVWSSGTGAWLKSANTSFTCSS